MKYNVIYINYTVNIKHRLIPEAQNSIYKKEELKSDIKSFSRKIKLRRHFHNKNENQQAEKIATEYVIRCISTRGPKNRNHQSKSKSSYC